jgi:OOP family OmpA-OmpF porin
MLRQWLDQTYESPVAKTRILLSLLSVLILASCAAYTARVNLDELNKTVPSGSEFTQRLTVEYRDLANYDENELMSYVNAEHFSKKGLKTAHGEVVPPENPSEWNISSDQMDALLSGRQKLVDMLDNGGREQAPDLAAVAQARFDCWVERAEKSTAVEDAGVCHSQFDEALTQAQAAIDKANQPPAQKPGAGWGTPGAGGNNGNMFLVFFDWNRATLTKAGMAVIVTVAEQAKQLGVTTIDVTGFADLSGTDRYNLKLSMLRAKAVKTALARHGIKAAMIRTDAKGDMSPLVPTGRGVKEPANRRAEIRFE